MPAPDNSSDEGGAAPAPGLHPRRAAWRMLADILCHGHLLHEAQARQAEALARLSPADRALAEHLLRTTLRRHGQLAHVLSHFLNRPLPRKACPAQAALLMGAAQLLLMRVPAHAAIATTVELLKRHPKQRHLAGLANAVLRRIASEGEKLLQQADPLRNIPGWLRHHWQRAWGEEAVAHMAQELLREPPLDITVREPETAADWAQRLGGMLLPTGSIRISQPQGPVSALPGYDDGAWWVQDAAAALPARLLASALNGQQARQPKLQGHTIADLCAAPGGKTAQLASLGARVQAVDISAPRLRRLRANMQRLHLSDRVEIIEADVLRWQPDAAPDAILLDAPCTATGTFRRHPDVLLAKSEQQLAELVELQQRMLRHAAGQLASGGMLVYCVCSLLPREGEEQVARFLASEAGQHFERLPARAEELAGQSRFITPEGDIRTLPHQPIGAAKGVDGFFIARLRRTG